MKISKRVRSEGRPDIPEKEHPGWTDSQFQTSNNSQAPGACKQSEHATTSNVPGLATTSHATACIAG
ncbi:hypothetical protein AB4156_22655 [Cupriavidus sp. 2MCAB6]|uniref:hypothetical protein n=1 Tax=Cupriavidus sp. 2MCAB6 TaxID=3232981 RepID=UPI003F933DB3